MKRYIICHGIENNGVYESVLNTSDRDTAINAIKRYAERLSADEVEKTTWLDLLSAEINDEGVDYQNSETIFTAINNEGE